MKHFLIFGTHPFLSLAEAKAVIGGSRPEVSSEMAVFDISNWDGAWLQDRLAGSMKLGEIVAEFPTNELTASRIADEIEARPREGKIEFGLTTYGVSIKYDRGKLRHLPLQLKKMLKERGHSVRWVTEKDGGLSPAAVAKAGLTTTGYDICVGFFGDHVAIGLSTNVQDADAWSLRDFGRPFHDELTGQLPPKLAHMMVNLAGGKRGTLLDPFCGGGSVLMEAGLIGWETLIGSDNAQTQIDGCEKNNQWLVEKKIWSEKIKATTILCDVQSIDQKLKGKKMDAIVTEGYLGRPLTGDETLQTLESRKKEIENLWRETLRSFSPLQKSGSRVVCVWPVFTSSHGTVAVDVGTDLEKFGYQELNPLEGWNENPPTLTYARQSSRVKRNIVILEKI